MNNLTSKELDLPFDQILVSIACACRFGATDENGLRMKDDQEFDQKYSGNVRRIMVEVSGFDEITDMDIIQKIINLVDEIDKKGIPEIL